MVDKGAREELKQDYARLKAAYDELASHHAELLGSYYLSGARKKIDVAALPQFAGIAARIKADGRSGMHLDRLYTLWQAVQQAPAGPVAEVGAYQGGSAKFIAESFLTRGMAPRFFVCDTFSGHARTDDVFDTVTHREGGKFLNTSPESVA